MPATLFFMECTIGNAVKPLGATAVHTSLEF